MIIISHGALLKELFAGDYTVQTNRRAQLLIDNIHRNRMNEIERSEIVKSFNITASVKSKMSFLCSIIAQRNLVRSMPIATEIILKVLTQKK